MSAMFVRICVVVVAYGISNLLPFWEIVVVYRSADVKARPPAKHSALAPGVDVLEAGSGECLEQCRGKRLSRVDEIESVMHDEALMREHLARSDVHAPVYLHGIGADDFTVKFEGDSLSQGGLSGSRRSDYADNRV